MQKIIETTEEKKQRLKGYQNQWRSNPDNAKKQYLSNQKTQAERWRRWRVKHLKEHTAKSALEKAKKLQRCPSWADLEAIKQFYLDRPEGYHVDHIIPLNGKTVSGLHVLENLQYLLAEENWSKSNKFTS